jgi:hypothetical protein
MAIKEYRVAQADTRPIRRRPLSMVRDLVPSQKDSKAGNNAPMRTKDQPAITAQGRSPRYDADSIMGVISSLRSPGEANTAYDPSKPVGGENVPYKPTTGIGGVLSRFFGNQANEMNVAAQEQQAAEKIAEEATAKERQAKKEDLAEEIRLREEGPAARFKISQTAADTAEANRVAAENKRLELEGKRIGLTERQIEEARQDRIDRLKGDQEDRAARIEDMRNRNALADAAFGENRLKANQPSMIGLLGGGLGVLEPRSGSISIVNPGTPGFGNMPGTPSTTRQVYPQVKAPAGVGAQVDRATGNTMGGRLPAEAEKPAASVVTPPRTGAWPGVGEVKPDVTGLYYTAEPQGSSTLLKETGAFDVPESVTKEMTQYAMSPEQRMNILKRYQTGLRANRSGFPQFAE